MPAPSSNTPLGVEQDKSSHLRRIQRPELFRIASEYCACLLHGEREKARSLILETARSGTSIEDLYLSVLQPVQYEMGRLWEENRISVALEHFSTAVTQLIMAQLFPSLLSEHRNGYRLVACCIGNELHELGMRMVADFLEMEGWDTYFLGANTPNEAILSALEDHGAHCLAVSVTMTHHLKQAQGLVKALRHEPRLKDVKLLIGGYPFTRDESLHQDFDADGWGRDAREAARMAKLLMSGQE